MSVTLLASARLVFYLREYRTYWAPVQQEILYCERILHLNLESFSSFNTVIYYWCSMSKWRAVTADWVTSSPCNGTFVISASTNFHISVYLHEWSHPRKFASLSCSSARQTLMTPGWCRYGFLRCCEIQWWMINLCSRHERTTSASEITALRQTPSSAETNYPVRERRQRFRKTKCYDKGLDVIYLPFTQLQLNGAKKELSP